MNTKDRAENLTEECIGEMKRVVEEGFGKRRDYNTKEINNLLLGSQIDDQRFSIQSTNDPLKGLKFGSFTE